MFVQRPRKSGACDRIGSQSSGTLPDAGLTNTSLRSILPAIFMLVSTSGWIERRGSLLRPVDLIDQTVGKRYHEQVAVRPGQHVGNDAEVSAEEQSFTFRNVKLADIVGDAIRKTRIVDGDVRAIGGQFEAEQ